MNGQFDPKRNGEEEEAAEKRSLRADRIQVGLPILAVAFIFLFSAVLQSLIATAVAAWSPRLLDLPGVSLALSMLPMYLVAMPLSLLLYRLVPRREIAKRTVSFPT